jgi:hypothetical protein
MITTLGSDSQEVGPLADRMPRKRSTRFVARRRAEMPFEADYLSRHPKRSQIICNLAQLLWFIVDEPKDNLLPVADLRIA